MKRIALDPTLSKRAVCVELIFYSHTTSLATSVCLFVPFSLKEKRHVESFCPTTRYLVIRAHRLLKRHPPRTSFILLPFRSTHNMPTTPHPVTRHTLHSTLRHTPYLLFQPKQKHSPQHATPTQPHTQHTYCFLSMHPHTQQNTQLNVHTRSLHYSYTPIHSHTNSLE